MSAVGERIRDLRKSSGWTLKQVAAASGLSTSFLSQVERGVSSASLASLSRVCECLGSSLADLLQDPPNGYSVAMPGTERDSILSHDARIPPVGISRSPIAYQFLAHDFPGRELEIILGELAPGSEFPPTSHAGEEFGYVLEGSLRLTVDGTEHTLHAGDSYHFKANTPHGYAVSGELPVRVLWAQTLTYQRSRVHPQDPAPPSSP